MIKAIMDIGGDREFVTKYWLKDQTMSIEGPHIKAYTYGEAERAIKELVCSIHGCRQSDVRVKATRLDGKSVWSKIDKDMTR